MKTFFAAAFLLTLASCAPGDDLSGDWSLCVADSTSRSVCGEVRAGPAQKPAFRYRRYYPLSYRLDLTPILGTSATQAPKCGSLLIGEDASISIFTKTRCDALFEFDTGNLVADRLTFAGDSIVGNWVQTCAAIECPAHGRLTMTRAH